MRTMPFLLTLAALALTFGSLSAQGQEVSRRQIDPSLDLDLVTHQQGVLAPTRIENALGGGSFSIVYDDGEPDNGYSASDEAFAYDLAMRFDLGASPVRVEELTLCFSRTGTDDELDFDLTFWAADGVNGAPGTFLDLIAATAPAVPSNLGGAFYTFDLSSLNVVLNSPTVYIGAGWNPSREVDFFLCSDHDGATVQPGYSMVNLDDNWGTPPAGDTSYTALMIRGVFDPVDSSGSCTPNATTLCLQNDRFKVEADWRRPGGQTGVGTGVELTPDTGYFWFFNSANVEMVVKVLNNCNGATNHFWVFAGGLTNVEAVLTVTDTLTGQSRRYTNPLGTPFKPIQDTGAFATCP